MRRGDANRQRRGSRRMTPVEAFSLHDRRALVIGGSSGIGREIALGFQAAGARVAVIGKTAGKVDEAVQALRMGGGDPLGYQADVADPGQLAAILGRALADLGRVDILVNSQGTTILKPAEAFTNADYDAIIDTNLRSVFFACTIVGRHML